MSTLRHRLGALIYDWPRYRRALRNGRWWMMHNRDETIVSDGRGVKCEWRFTSDLHIARVFPSAARQIMRAAFAQWPVVLGDEPVTGQPEVSFVIGHRGLDRLPHLLATLRSIAGQNTAVECIVVEQSARREIETRIPSWVRYIHTPVAPDYDYNRAWTLNEGARAASAETVILHDNDMLVPSAYAAEAAARVRDGWQFVDLKRFAFYLDAAQTSEFVTTGRLRTDLATTITQNMRGGSVVVSRAAFLGIGGYDEDFVGWGGEDNEFWERAAVGGKVNPFAYLPLIHLHHPSQRGKGDASAPAVKRYHDLQAIPPEERIARLLARQR